MKRQSIKISRFICCCAFFISSIVSAAPKHPTKQYDLIVYGGTAAGAMTPIAAARHGLHVVLLEPASHIGGMLTGGLSATDVGNPKVIGASRGSSLSGLREFTTLANSPTRPIGTSCRAGCVFGCS